MIATLWHQLRYGASLYLKNVMTDREYVHISRRPISRRWTQSWTCWTRPSLRGPGCRLPGCPSACWPGRVLWRARPLQAASAERTPATVARAAPRANARCEPPSRLSPLVTNSSHPREHAAARANAGASCPRAIFEPPVGNSQAPRLRHFPGRHRRARRSAESRVRAGRLWMPSEGSVDSE